MTNSFDDPRQFPFSLDAANRRVLFVDMPPHVREEAAFLDERALPPGVQGSWYPLEQTVAAAHALPAYRVDFIFHLGHCGSSLLSRVLQSWPEMQVLREPLPLRTLASLRQQPAPDAAQRERITEALLRLWARPLAAHARTLIKATSSCNGLADELLAADAQRHAILLQVSLQRYLATILKAAGSVRDALAAAAERAQDLHMRSAGMFVPPNPADLPAICAMGWLAERLRFDALAREYGARVLQVDFDALLAQPGRTLSAIADCLGLESSRIEAALASPAWHRYAKDTRHGYDVNDRAHDLELAHARHGEEIARGVRWVEGQLGRMPSAKIETAC